MAESDLLKVSLTCATFITATLLWVFGTKQTVVERTFARACSIALRILIIHGAVVGLLYGLDGIAIDTLLKWLPVAVVLMLLTKPKYLDVVALVPGDDLAAIVLFVLFGTVFLPLYLMKQFVLGFPDRNIARNALDPPEQQLPIKTMPDFPPNGTAGIVSASLRPMGTVEIEGTAFPARHRGHQLLDVGTAVLTCGVQNGTLLVKETDVA